MIIAAVLAVSYVVLPHRPTARTATLMWMLGCCTLAAAFSPLLDDRAHALFVAHMVQHLLIIFVAAPLLALGRPITRWVSPWARPHRRPVSAHLVVTAAIGLIGVVYLTHLPVFYDAALRHPAVHTLEHGAYLYAGIVYWVTIFEADPLPRRAGHGTRIAALLALPPALGLLAAAIGSADSILYVEQSATLADQRAGAALMWIAPMAIILPAALHLVLAWARHEERTERRIPSSAAARQAGSFYAPPTYTKSTHGPGSGVHPELEVSSLIRHAAHLRPVELSAAEFVVGATADEEVHRVGGRIRSEVRNRGGVTSVDDVDELTGELLDRALSRRRRGRLGGRGG